MRPQNRPFVVEIKKTKRGGAPAQAGAPAAPPPATWAEQFEQATALTDSAARKAAEALFSPPRSPAPVAPRARSEDPSPTQRGRDEAPSDVPSSPDASSRKGRILVAIGSEVDAAAPAAAAEPSAEVAPVDRPAPRIVRPRKADGAAKPPASTLVAGPAATSVARPAPKIAAKTAAKTEAKSAPAAWIEPIPAPRPVVAKAVPAPVFPEETSSLATPAPAARKGVWRRGGEALARGEKWKRRLPQALR